VFSHPSVMIVCLKVGLPTSKVWIFVGIVELFSLLIMDTFGHGLVGIRQKEWARFLLLSPMRDSMVSLVSLSCGISFTGH